MTAKLFVQKTKEKLTKRGEKSLMDLTPSQIIEAALDLTDPNVFTEKHKAAIRATWLPLFEKPGK